MIESSWARAASFLNFLAWQIHLHTRRSAPCQNIQIGCFLCPKIHFLHSQLMTRQLFFLIAALPTIQHLLRNLFCSESWWIMDINKKGFHKGKVRLDWKLDMIVRVFLDLYQWKINSYLAVISTKSGFSQLGIHQTDFPQIREVWETIKDKRHV